MADEHEPAGRAIRAWWPIVATTVGLLVTGTVAWTSTRTELAALRAKVAALETIDDRLDRLERKLDLLLCASDPARCSSVLLENKPALGR